MSHTGESEEAGPPGAASSDSPVHHRAALDAASAFNSRYDGALTQAMRTHDMVEDKFASLTALTGMPLAGLLDHTSAFEGLGKLSALTGSVDQVPTHGIRAAMEAESLTEGAWEQSDTGLWVLDRDPAMAHMVATIVVTYVVGFYLTELNRIGESIQGLNRAGLLLEAGGIVGLYRWVFGTVLGAFGRRDQRD